MVEYWIPVGLYLATKNVPVAGTSWLACLSATSAMDIEGRGDASMMCLPGVKFLENVEIPEASIQSGAIKLMEQLRPNWKPEDIEVTVFTDGISNKLVGCSLKTDSRKQDVILVRVYGQKTELLVDREAELVTMAMMNAARCAEPLYAKFKNGIAYGFISGECLDENTVRDDVIASLIAKEMIRVNSIEPEKVLPSVKLTDTHSVREAMFYKKLAAWIKIVPESYTDPEKNKRYKSLIASKDILSTELELLHKELVALNSPVVFCHNDLLLKNIVYNKDKGRTFFIDFEYGGFNYQAYEIANHFCEYAGIEEVDYKRYPDRAYQLRWLRRFLQYQREHEGRAGSEVTDIDVERLYVAVNKCALGAHFFWGIWALLQASFSTIDFDYMEYAELRLGEYFKRKEEFMALKMP